MQPPTGHLVRLLCSLGMVPQDGPGQNSAVESYEVILDGRVLGYVSQDQASQLVDKLRILKVKQQQGVSLQIEIFKGRE